MTDKVEQRTSKKDKMEREKILVPLVDQMQLLHRSQKTLQEAVTLLLDEVTSARSDIQELGETIDSLHGKLDNLTHYGDSY
jgi:hypothetical protein